MAERAVGRDYMVCLGSGAGKSPSLLPNHLLLVLKESELKLLLL